MTTNIILHHYDASPFTQKALRMLGLKNLNWRSVETPIMLPKPDLVCLTGGYRGTPVMQIGADLYIDTQRIARELERRYPEPTFFPAADAGLAYALVKWSDEFFQAGLRMALALLGPDWDAAFREDRQALFAHLNFDDMDKETGHAMAQLRASAALLDAQLADGRSFLTGDHAGLADMQAFSVPWVTRAAMPVTEKLLQNFDHLPAWEARVAELGEGERQTIDASEAHRVAQESQPDLTSKIRGAETNPESGPGNLAESTAELFLIGGVVGTEDPTGSFVDSIVFRLTPGGKSFRSVDLSSEGASISYLDNFRAFDIPQGQWSAVWRRGNGPILDPGEIVEMRINLRSLYPPLGPRTAFAIRVNPVRGSVLTVRRTTPSKIASIMDLN